MKKLPVVKRIFHGCITCSTSNYTANMHKQIAVGFGSAFVTKNKKFFYDGERDYQNDKEPKSFYHIERIARKHPRCDWRIHFYGPMKTEVYQRQGKNKWLLIKSESGFA